MNKKWYAVQTLAGSEKRARLALIDAIERRGEGAKVRFGEILLPMEDVVEVRNGKKRPSKRKKFPGYLFVEVDLDEAKEMESLIRATPRISGLFKDPLPQMEVDRIKGTEKSEDLKPKILVNFQAGDEVRIIEGAFASMKGIVEQVHLSRQRLRVQVSIFGRLTSVDLDFTHVERPE
jgi:transcriptional antiterminator NusG